MEKRLPQLVHAGKKTINLLTVSYIERYDTGRIDVRFVGTDKTVILEGQVARDFENFMTDSRYFGSIGQGSSVFDLIEETPPGTKPSGPSS